jgi:hypothetical protein
LTLGENAGLPLAVLTWCAVLSGMEAGGAGGSGPKRVGKQYYPDIGFFDMIEKAPGVSVKKGTCKFCRADVDLRLALISVSPQFQLAFHSAA